MYTSFLQTVNEKKKMPQETPKTMSGFYRNPNPFLLLTFE